MLANYKPEQALDDDLEQPRHRPAFWTLRRKLLVVLLLAALLRLWAVLVLPVDFDEPVYVGAGIDYADALRSADLNGVIDYYGNREHPALVKLLYAAGALLQGEQATNTSVLFSSRAISAIFGVAAVALLAWLFGPLAGGMLAIHTMTVKYTSQAYLEAVPLFMLLLALGAALRARQAEPGTAAGRRWLWVSAVALGATAAGKLTYLLITPVLLFVLFWHWPVRWRSLLLYALLSFGCFLLLNPTLWHDPPGRLLAQFGFYASYTQSQAVLRAGYPWYQPLIWVASSAPADWHPDVFFYYGFDGPLFLLALAGLPHAWRTPQRRWLPIWLLGGLLVLLLWPTKWPQYSLIVAPAICILAADTLTRLVDWLRELDAYWGWIPAMLPRPPAYAWIALAIFVLFLGGVYGYGVANYALGRIGWSELAARSLPLPRSPLYDLLALPDGRIALASERGAAIWTAPETADRPPGWQVLSGSGAALPQQRVLALARDPQGGLWLGTERGLARYDGTGWQLYGPDELGTQAGLVRSLATGTDGRLWVGTGSGALLGSADGRRWTALPEAAGGSMVFAVAVQAQPAGDLIWFGGLGVLSRYDSATGEWRHFGRESGFRAGVAGLLPDSQGRLWAATSGDGLACWDGQRWTWFTPANSQLPSTMVNTLLESSPGVLWIGTAWPVESGGVLTRYDGQSWQTYQPSNSGFSGAEPLAMAVGSQEQLWIATRTGDVSIYQLPR